MKKYGVRYLSDGIYSASLSQYRYTPFTVLVCTFQDLAGSSGKTQVFLRNRGAEQDLVASFEDTAGRECDLDNDVRYGPLQEYTRRNGTDCDSVPKKKKSDGTGR